MNDALQDKNGNIIKPFITDGSTPLQTLLQRLNAVMKEVDSVVKGKTIGAGNSSYDVVEHDDVTALLHGPFAEKGIIALPSISNCEINQIKTTRKGQGGSTYEVNEWIAKVWVETTFYNSDYTSDCITLKSFAYAFDQSDKAVGKAFSMAVKYTYLKALMLESKDKEEDRVEYNRQSYQQRPQQKPQLGQEINQQPKTTNDAEKRQATANSPMLATDAQKNVLKKLNLHFDQGITAKQASDMITEFNRSKGK